MSGGEEGWKIGKKTHSSLVRHERRRESRQGRAALGGGSGEWGGVRSRRVLKDRGGSTDRN